MVRPALSRGSDRADAQAAGRSLAHRLPAALERGRDRGDAAGTRAITDSAASGLNRRARRLGVDLDLDLQCALARAGELRAWPCAVRRRCGTSGADLRRARTELRFCGCAQPGLEARLGVAGQVGREPAGEL